jgi:hypothetical protein
MMTSIDCETSKTSFFCGISLVVELEGLLNVTMRQGFDCVHRREASEERIIVASALHVEQYHSGLHFEEKELTRQDAVEPLP